MEREGRKEGDNERNWKEIETCEQSKRRERRDKEKYETEKKKYQKGGKNISFVRSVKTM